MNLATAIDFDTDLSGRGHNYNARETEYGHNEFATYKLPKALVPEGVTVTIEVERTTYSEKQRSLRIRYRMTSDVHWTHDAVSVDVERTGRSSLSKVSLRYGSGGLEDVPASKAAARMQALFRLADQIAALYE